MTHARRFSPSYAEARRRFREAVSGPGWTHEALPIGQKGPQGEDLTIDVARIGPESARRVIVFSSGTHGVEGYFGSAVQLALLEERLKGVELPADSAVLLIHAVNPYGMAWVRRVNEDNVDLNRNFLPEGEEFSGEPEGYSDFNELLNPETPPGGFEAFLLRAGLLIVRHGMSKLKGAIAPGQYDYPKGVFFGGTGPSRSQELLREGLPRWVKGAERVIHIDLHTGVGKSGTFLLALSQDGSDPGLPWLESHFEYVQPLSTAGELYPIRGAFGEWCRGLFPDIEYHCMLAEFGTHPIVEVIGALRMENRAHHYADKGSRVSEKAKARLLEAFAPAAPKWRQTVVDKALGIWDRAWETLAEPPSQP